VNPSITLGRVAGIRIGINWSWLVVFALIVWSLASSVFPSQNPHLADGTYVGMALVAALFFFASLLLHELGHALQARREGMEIDGITLWLFGGVARFRGMFPSAGAELRIALAGPFVSLALGGLFVGLAQAVRSPAAVEGVAAWLGYINLILLVFNLLPALPLDGGRVFRALLWRAKGDFGWATRIAADAGRAFGYLLIGLGLVLLVFAGAWSGAWFAFLGWFLVQAATAEARSTILREALGGLQVGDVMIHRPVVVRADASLAEFIDVVAHTHRYTTYPVVENGHVLGLLPFSCVARVPRGEWETQRIRESMLAVDEVPVIHEDEPLTDALAELREGGLDRALVLDGDHLAGLLSITDVGRLLSESSAVRRNRR
jgi:Zn-dependent protease/predicted transcriptional regulator